MTEAMLKALDLHAPDWYIMHAHVQDMQEAMRLCFDGHSGTVKAREQLRRRTLERMWLPVRAAIEARIVQVVDKKP